MNCPFLTKEEYLLSSIDDEGYLTLIDADSESKCDLTLPMDQCYEEFRERFMKDYNDEKSLTVTVTKCLGREMVLDYKLDLGKD